MDLSGISSEVWIQIHYRYNGELFRFNLPLRDEEKPLDGLSLYYSRTPIHNGLRFTFSMESLTGVELESFEITGALEYGDNVKSVFVNGYQSWTGSRELDPSDKMSALSWPGRLSFFQNYGDARFYPYSERKGRFHGYSYAYVRYPDSVLFAGSLDESTGFTAIGLNIRHNLFSVFKDVKGLKLSGRRRMLDIVLMQGTLDEVCGEYASYRRQSALPARRAFWWSPGRRNSSCGDEVRMRRVLASLRSGSIPVDYFLVDHGWCANMGDWDLPAAGIPSGMASLAAEIKGSGYKPGLWFAPFAAGVESDIYRNRKEWLARDSKNKIRPAGWLTDYGGLYFALDLNRDDVRDFIAGCIARFRDEWGFELLRLDLLYAASLFPSEGKSRGEAMKDAVDFLVSIKGSLKYEMSGIPLEAAFGKAEYCRIAAESTPYWEHLYKKNIHAEERASTLNSLRSTVGRHHLDGLFFANSAASFYLGGPGVSMEKHRRFTHILLNYLLGSFIGGCGDIDVCHEDDRRTLLSLFPFVKPHIDDISEYRQTITISYSIAKRSYVSVVNLADRARAFTLPEGFWFSAPSAGSTPLHLPGGNQQILKPGWSATFMRMDLESTDVFSGSDGHLIPGCEISSITFKDGSFTIRPASEVSRDFRVWLRASGDKPVMINGVEADSAMASGGLKLASGIVKINT